MACPSVAEGMSAVRIRSMLALTVAVVVGVVGPGSAAAAAETPLGSCSAGAPPSHSGPVAEGVPGNAETPWFTPLSLANGDALRATASGRVRVDHWGTNKSIAGELPVAGGGWPAPGLPRYMLIGKVTIGAMWLKSTGLTYGPGQWFPVGPDSGCMLYLSASPPQGGRLVFSFNDDNLGDNGGGAAVLVAQWI